MALEIHEVRPAVITGTLCNELEEYLRFRHLFRGLYGFELETEKMAPLFERIDPVFAELEKQIAVFLQTLADLAKGIEGKVDHDN